MNRRIRADHARGKTRYPETDAAFHETRLWLDAAQARGEAAVVVRFTPGESLDGLPRRDACRSMTCAPANRTPGHFAEDCPITTPHNIGGLRRLPARAWFAARVGSKELLGQRD